MDDDAPEAMPQSCAGASSKPFQRFEVYTGSGRRRSFTTEEKLALVAQMAGCENISELARRHQLRPSQLFTWRRELRYAAEAAAPRALAAPEPMFVPAVIEPELAASAGAGQGEQGSTAWEARQRSSWRSMVSR